MSGNNGNDLQAEKIIKVKITSSEQIVEVLKTVSDKDTLIIPEGCGSRNIPLPDTSKQIIKVSFDKYDEVNELQQQDFYIDCQAGVSLSSLYDTLTEHNLKFPFLEKNSLGTVGGMVGSGQIITGEKCYNISRWVLALKIIMADGSEIEAGAVTYKSVAGYDLPKLFSGSFGTLGIITNVVLRCYSETGKAYGKDLEAVKVKIPKLTDDLSECQLNSEAEKIAQKIKQEFDPDGIFPIIKSWNK